MCGIAGFWRNTSDQSTDWLEEIASTMANTLVHRGPDDCGTWVDQEVGVAFGHRRLSIIDISDAGHQPMVSANGRYVIIYNGEVYNFKELRQQLEQLGHTFRSHSDTEVMLAAFVQWGPSSSLERFNGMWAPAGAGGLFGVIEQGVGAATMLVIRGHDDAGEFRASLLRIGV